MEEPVSDQQHMSFK